MDGFAIVIFMDQLMVYFKKICQTGLGVIPSLRSVTCYFVATQAWPDLWASEERVKAAQGGPVQSRPCPVTGQTLCRWSTGHTVRGKAWLSSISLSSETQVSGISSVVSSFSSSEELRVS